jgi:hypothetical protein
MLGLLLALAGGAVVGLAGANATTLGFWTLLPWALGAFLTGYLARRRPALAGAIYGFALSFSFIVSVYTGAASVMNRMPYFTLLGVVGAVCGALLAVIGASVSSSRTSAG